MSQKIAKDSTTLQLDSKVKEQNNNAFLSPNKFNRIPISPLKDTGASTPLQRKCSQYKLSQQSQESEGKHSNNSLPVLIAKLNSSQTVPSHAKTEICRLREERDILQRNVQYEIEFYIRERMKDLITIQELLLANQYQRVQKYVETQLSLLRKRHQNFLNEDTCCKPTLTKDISIKSNIEDDMSYNELINNLVNNLKQFELSNTFILPIVKNLVNQTQISTKKLAWYFQQVPFEASKHTSKNLAIKFISQLGCSDGRKVLQLISKSIQQNTRGKYSLTYQQQPQKSEMSKLIQQHSISKIRSNKKLREQLSL